MQTTGGFLLLAAALLAPASAGCEKTWTQTPDGFVKVEAPGFEWKAVAPDGSAIGIRYRKNEEKGTLSFWAEVFELELVKGKGYRLVDKTDLTSADGVTGRLLRFEFAQGATPYHYGLAIFVTDESIVTVETATELERLPHYASAFDAARRQLRAKAAE